MTDVTNASSVHRCPTCGSRLRPRHAERRVSIQDAMILIAASAVAFMIGRALLGGDYPAGLHWSFWLFSILTGGIVAWTPAVLWIALRNPRPNLRRLARQPGFVASLTGTVLIALAVLVVGVFGLIRIGAHMARPSGLRPASVSTSDSTWWVQIIFYHASLVGAAVAAAWILLALSGRRRPTGRWIDNLGRLLGTIWIVVFLVRMVTSLWYLRR